MHDKEIWTRRRLLKQGGGVPVENDDLFDLFILGNTPETH
jgi:hypothetical protein